MSTLPAIRAPSLPDLAAQAVVGYRSVHTRRVYAARIRQFIATGLPLTREAVREWLARVRDGTKGELKPAMRGYTPDRGRCRLCEEGATWVHIVTISNEGMFRSLYCERHKPILAPASSAVVNQCIKAIKALVQEAEVRGLLSPQDAQLITDVAYEREAGVRRGNWLSQEAAARLYAAPDRSTLRGKRDAAVFALLLGCALRRAEAAELTWGNYQEREGRMVLLDIRGKGGKIRTVPVPRFAQRDLDAWAETIRKEGLPGGGEQDKMLIGFAAGFDYRDIYRTLGGSGMWRIVKAYAEKMGPEFAKVRPHDLRRTLAQLMRNNGAELEQIAATLGHQSIVTTQRYLGVGLELGKGRAAVDRVQL